MRLCINTNIEKSTQIDDIVHSFEALANHHTPLDVGIDTTFSETSLHNFPVTLSTNFLVLTCLRLDPAGPDSSGFTTKRPIDGGESQWHEKIVDLFKQTL